MYENRIRHLEETHRVLDKEIADMERNHPHVEESKVAKLKRSKLQLKDQIARLYQLQHQHEATHSNEKSL